MANNKKIHEGHSIKRFREMLGINQQTLAFDLGEDWTQKKVSLLESKETIDPAILQQVSAVLKIPVEAIQNFDEEQAVNFITNTFNDHSNGYNYYPEFNINPVEKSEAQAEIKRLKIELLNVKDEQIQLLRDVLEKMK